MFRRDGDTLRVAAVISAADVVKHSLLAATERPEGDGEEMTQPEDTAALASHATLGELGMAVKTVFTVDADDAALHAFQRMTRLGFTSAAAVSGYNEVGTFDGEVVCDVTASDIGGVWPNNFHTLTSPLRNYIKRLRGVGPDDGENGAGAVLWRPRPPPPKFFKRSTTFAQVIKRLSQPTVHHGFVAEDCAGVRVTSKDLIGVVTQTDVLRRICFEDEYLSECLSG